MVEVHLMRLEYEAAVVARNTPKVAKQFELTKLADLDSGAFAVAISSVVVDVCRALIPRFRHSSG